MTVVSSSSLTALELNTNLDLSGLTQLDSSSSPLVPLYATNITILTHDPSRPQIEERERRLLQDNVISCSSALHHYIYAQCNTGYPKGRKSKFDFPMGISFQYTSPIILWILDEKKKITAKITNNFFSVFSGYFSISFAAEFGEKSVPD